MRKKIELFGLRMKAAVQSHPVEDVAFGFGLCDGML